MPSTERGKTHHRTVAGGHPELLSSMRGPFSSKWTVGEEERKDARRDGKGEGGRLRYS